MFKTIVIDPPWNERGGGKIKRGADRHYKLLKTPDIVRVIYQSGLWLPNPEGCHVYLWTTNNHIQEAFFVLEALGAAYKTKLTWFKNKFGLGYYFRGKDEPCLAGAINEDPDLPDAPEEPGLEHDLVDDQPCLFGLVGKLKTATNNTPTAFGAKATTHSRKPDKFFEIVEANSPAPRLELFATEYRPGWVGWGMHTDSDGVDTVGIVKKSGTIHPFNVKLPSNAFVRRVIASRTVPDVAP